MKSRESANDFSETQIWKTLKFERSYEKLFPNLIKRAAISGVFVMSIETFITTATLQNRLGTAASELK